MSALRKPKYTVAEYIELLLNSDERFEYFDGEVVSMAGGKMAHASIGHNIGLSLGMRLLDRSCRIFGGDMAIKVPLAPPFRYPDVSVVCGELVIEELRGFEMLVNPLLIVEVLSKSTAEYDRSDKFLAYQSIASFQEYLLVAQHRPYITQYVKRAEGEWVRSDIIGLESEVKLQSLNIALPLSEIYRMIEFPPQVRGPRP